VHSITLCLDFAGLGDIRSYAQYFYFDRLVFKGLSSVCCKHVTFWYMVKLEVENIIKVGLKE
jgi:hypothetical protein